MGFDINRLLDIDYLNELASNFNIEIMNLSSSCLELYSLEMFKDYSTEKINELFGQYNFSCSSVIQYYESDFIDDNWEFGLKLDSL